MTELLPVLLLPQAAALDLPRPPSWITRAAVAVHRGAPVPGVVAVDAAAAVSVAVLADVSLLLPSLLVVALLLSGRTYRDRDRIVARGLAWWPRLLLGPALLAGLATTVLDRTPPARTGVATAATLLALLAVRSLAWLWVSLRRRAGRDRATCLVVGSGERAATLARTLARHPDFGLDVTTRLPVERLGDPVALGRAVRASGSDHVLLVAGGATAAPLRRALGLTAHFSLVPEVSDALLDARAGHRVGGIAVLPLGRPLRGPTALRGKRTADVLGSLLLLALSGPLLLASALAIRLVDGGPVLYRQRRTGRHGRPFEIVKLRTMRRGAHTEQGALTTYNTSDGLLFKMAADPRITRTGGFLRTAGLDELPQLWNVLRGDMSLVGPRPLPVEAASFSPRDGERHLVLPGMTGLWQVSGGSSLRYREMVDLDLAYVHGWSLALDAQILASTVGVLAGAVLRR